jgi:adenylate kinase family enzyme
MSRKPKKMKRILVIGMPGGGKSTLAKTLHEQLGLPLYHLDRLFWMPSWKERPDDEWEEIQTDLISRKKWIIDGSYARTLPLRLTKADTVIHIDLSRPVCLWRVTKRILRSYGKVRSDMAEGCPEHWDWSFYKWIWNYPRRHRLQILDLLYEIDPRVTVITLTNSRAVKKFLTTTT